MTTYPKNWTTDAIRKYITQESQQKDRESFEKTHVPISRIRVEEDKAVSSWVDEDQRLVGEEIVLETVLDSTPDQGNRLFFVVGESGSGKSELCQWLDYKIQDEVTDQTSDSFAHEPILIPRQVREPRDVLQLLTENLDEWDFEDVKYLSDLPESGIFKTVTGNIINRFNKRQTATVDFLNDDLFEDKVKTNLSEYVDTFADPDQSVEFEPISQESLESLLEKFPRVTHEHEHHDIEPTEYLYREIKTAATDAIEEMLFDGDFIDVLNGVDEAYRERNRRPVLIIEDLTGFTIYDHQVLSFFSDLGSAHFDVIVGVTTGVHRRLIDKRRADVSSEDTIDDRTMARFRLTEETADGTGSRTLFLEQEDVHIDLARKYLTAIKSETDAQYEPPLPAGLSADDVESAFGDGLYPFNEQFLTRIYQNLQEDEIRKQTPRVYLTFVIEELLNSITPPFEHAEKLQQRLGVIENPISPSYNGEDEPVLKWYGVVSGRAQVADSRIPGSFGIDSEGRAPIVDDPVDVCPECGTGIYQDSDEWVCPECGYESTSGDTRRETFDEQKNELLAWCRGETDFNQTKNIERGAERVIRFFHRTPDSLVRPGNYSQSAAYFRWEKGSTRVPVHIDNGDSPNFTQVVLNPDLDEKLLRDLLRVGVWDDIGITTHDAKENIDLGQLREWADDAVQTLRADIESDIHDTYGADLDEIAIFGKYLLNVFTGTSTEFTARALAQPVDESRIQLAFSTTAFEGDLNKLQNKAEFLRGLFHARFHVRRNVVDADQLEETVGDLDPEKLLLRIGSISGSLKGLKIGPKSSETIEFDTLLKSPVSLNIRGFARDIDEYSSIFADDLESIRSEYGGLYRRLNGIESEFDIKTLTEAYSVVTRQQPNDLSEIDDIELSTVKTLMSELESIAQSVETCDSVWDFLLLKQTAYQLKYKGSLSDYFSQFSTFVDELEGLETDLDARIAELEDTEFNPDTESFDQAQQTARTLRERLGESL
ncbi:hypothetical protein [Salinigranum halophilum]|uniref:hypothetical protein n=1 Tax=Salinigranum halophilum TaxID=2565931 RepID=UPI00115E35DC|nr:hypothetical protein [Salinigranum halophilum]